VNQHEIGSRRYLRMLEPELPHIGIRDGDIGQGGFDLTDISEK
jgi:hypothetical protein